MSSLILSYLDDESAPVVYSTPPRVGSDGDERPAQVTLQPWGPEIIDPEKIDQPLPEPVATHITMLFSLDEAEILARRLIEVVLAAKEGVYSDVGHELVAFSREKDLNDAWRALGLSDPND